ncbi:MAG: molybdopterin converting factor subunit 1 [Parvularculaceae bacterium]
MVRVLFFGRLRELAGAAELTRALPEKTATAEDLARLLAAENPELGAALAEPSVRVAIDREFAARSAQLAGASEVAFMPPLSGG